MKKISSKGFMMVETLIVASFIIITLVFLYVQFQSINKSYDRSFRYNTVNGLYNAGTIRSFVFKDGYNKLVEDLPLKSNNHILVYSSEIDVKCPSKYIKEVNYCINLMNSLNVKSLIFTKENLKNLNNKLVEWKKNRELPLGFSNKLADYIKTVKYDGEYQNYRLIVEYNDDTYASIKVAVE